MAAMSTIKVRVEPELSEDFAALLGAATEDTLNKVNAGAQLVYAVRAMGREIWDGRMSNEFVEAYLQACKAYGVK